MSCSIFLIKLQASRFATLLKFSLLSFVFIRFITRRQSLSRIVIFCHSLSLAIRCHLLYHSFQSLSFVLPLVVIRCHSLSFVLLLVASLCNSLSFVITRCSTCLSFYRRSYSRTNKTQAFLRKKIYDGKKLSDQILLHEKKVFYFVLFFIPFSHVNAVKEPAKFFEPS